MTFESLGLHPQILQALTDAGYTQPTPVQQEAVRKQFLRRSPGAI